MSWENEAVNYLKNFSTTFVGDFIHDELYSRREKFPSDLRVIVERLADNDWLAFIYDPFLYALLDLEQKYEEYLSRTLPRADMKLELYFPDAPTTDLRPDKPFEKMSLREVAAYVRRIGNFLKELENKGWVDVILTVHDFEPNQQIEFQKFTSEANKYAEEVARLIEQLAEKLETFIG